MKTKATFLMLLAISTSNAQESSTEATTTEEVTVSEEVTETAEADEAGPTLEVTVALKNGITLTGTVSQSDLLTWAPGADLSFTPTGGTAR